MLRALHFMMSRVMYISIGPFLTMATVLVASFLSGSIFFVLFYTSLFAISGAFWHSLLLWLLSDRWRLNWLLKTYFPCTGTEGPADSHGDRSRVCVMHMLRVWLESLLMVGL